MDTLPATPQACVERMEAITAELERLSRFPELTGAQEAAVEEMRAEFETLSRRRIALAFSQGDPSFRFESGSPNGEGGPGMPTGERDRAARTIDQAFRTAGLPAHGAERALALVEGGRPREQALAARWAIATGDPAYTRAFARLCADPERGHLLWDAQEQAAFRRVAELQTEMRGMSLTDSAGGYMVPLQLDPTILLTNSGTTSTMRKVARVVQTVTDSWQGVSSAGVSAEWKAESDEAADGTPGVGSVPIPVHMGSAFVPYSYEIGMDAVGFVSELQKLLTDAAENLAATGYTTGSGSGQPKGIIKALDGTASEVAPIAAETFDVDDVYALLEALPPRFRANATWQANLSVLNLLDRFESGNGSKQFPELGAAEPRLLRRPVLENSDMDGTFNVAATQDNFLLLVGDFREFIIADRIGSTLELIPHLFGANGRPTGERGAHLWFRTGSDVSTINAFRVLNIATTA